MPQSWNIIGWLVIGWLCLIVAALFFGVGKVLVEIQIAQWRYRRANAGKLRCQDSEPCYAMATRQTPNGFFCDAHWPDHSRKHILSGSVSYATRLDWSKD